MFPAASPDQSDGRPGLKLLEYWIGKGNRDVNDHDEGIRNMKRMIYSSFFKARSIRMAILSLVRFQENTYLP